MGSWPTLEISSVAHLGNQSEHNDSFHFADSQIQDSAIIVT